MSKPLSVHLRERVDDGLPHRKAAKRFGVSRRRTGEVGSKRHDGDKRSAPGPMPLQRATGGARRAILCSFGAAALLGAALVVESIAFDHAREKAAVDQAAASAVADKILVADERLAMSARLAAETGDADWARLYDRTGLELETALQEATALAPRDLAERFESVSEPAVARLYEMERRSIALGLQGRSAEARSAITNPSYNVLRRQLVEATRGFLRDLSARADERVREVRVTSWFLNGLICALALLGFIALWRTLKNYTGRAEAEQRRVEESLRTLSLELEQRVSERTQQLQNHEHFLTAALESLHSGIIAVDPGGQVTLSNREARRIDPALNPGVSVADLAPTGILLDGLPVDMSEPNLPVNRVLRGETVRDALICLVSPDGSRREVSINAEPIIDDVGARLGAVLSMEDVTERRSTEEQLRQATKMEAVGQLTGGLAHDFNNLLSVVIGNLDLLEPKLAGDPEAMEQAETALSASLKGADMTRQLLAFSRKQPLRTEAVPVNQLVQGMEPLLRQTLGEWIVLSVELEEDLQRARVDPSQVEAALLNLSINARDAMPKGGRLTIATKNHRLDQHYADLNPGVVPGDYVLLTVSDTGGGIPTEHLNRVFEPFFTTKEVGKGSGLGLSMIYGFAKQSGGHLKIYSEVGHGTTVRLYLPATEAIAQMALDESARVIERAPDNELILVVEDNAEVRKTVVGQLASIGYRTIEAADAAEALEQLEAHPEIDLVFTDVVMPGGMSGADVGRAVRDLRPNLPVLYTSGFAEAALINGQGHDIARERLLSKPYRKEDLARKMLDVLQAR